MEDGILKYLEEQKTIKEGVELPSTEISIRLDDELLLAYLLQEPSEFPKRVRNAYIQLCISYLPAFDREEVRKRYSDTKIRFSIPNHIKMKTITPKMENVPVSFDCIILGVDERKTFVQKCKIFCKKCELSDDRDGSYRSPPDMVCNKCNRLCDVVPSSVISEYVQTVVLQESLEESSAHSPVTFIGKLTGDLVGDVFVSQRKRIVGVFRSVVVPKKVENDINIDIISVDDLGEVKYTVPDKTDLKWLKLEAKKPDFFDKLASSFAPHIFGHKDIKKTILLQLAGGVRLENKRGDINVLLLGDPSVAKSQLLKFAQSITQKSMYTSGKGTSNAGLTIGIVKRSDGTNLAQAGILPLCNDGFAMIDELDKMLDHDRSGLHEAMEQQCYDDKTEILTENGWKFFKDVKKGEKVASLNNDELEFVKPTKYIATEYNGKVYKIKSRQVDLVVTPNHNMYVNINKRADEWNGFKLIKMCNIPKKRIRLKKNCVWKGKDVDTFGIPSIIKKLNQKKSIETGIIKVKMDDWLEFLGYYLSEGSFGRINNIPYTITISQSISANQQKRKRIINCIERLGFKYSLYGNNITIHSKQIASYVKQFGKSGNKHIPDDVKNLCPRQLKILFNSLMLGDGHTRKSTESQQYYTSSKKLSDDFQELCLKIGESANIYKTYEKGDIVKFPRNRKFALSNDNYRVSVIHEKQCKPNILPKHITEDTYSGKIFCVEVPHHVLYVRRCGIPIWCGNTVSIAKAGIALTLPARASVLAAANPKTGRWNPDLRYVQDNVNLSTTLLSRFDVKWLIRDLADDVTDTYIASHILEQYERSEKCFMEKGQLISYFNYIRQLEPKMTKEANVVLMKFYKKIRGITKEQNIIQIDTRQLEGLIRMSIAHAKILFKEKVDESDVESVIKIYKESLKGFGIDFDTGKVETNPFKTTSELNKSDTFDAIFEKLKDTEGFVSKKALIDELSKTKYYSEDQAGGEIEKRLREIRLTEPKGDGRVKRVPR